MTKKSVLIISVAYLVYVVGILVVDRFCKSLWCNIHDDDFFGQIFFAFSPLGATFLLSLITYKMKEEVFRAWWNFARWFVPIIMMATYLLNNAPTGGSLNAKQDATFFFLFILYAILIITSLTKIFRTYRKTKA
jgi:hypothetical protein